MSADVSEAIRYLESHALQMSAFTSMRIHIFALIREVRGLEEIRKHRELLIEEIARLQGVLQENWIKEHGLV